MDRETREGFQRVSDWQKEHVKMHNEEAQARIRDRHWLIGSVFIPTAAVLVSAVGIIIAVLVTQHP